MRQAIAGRTLAAVLLGVAAIAPVTAACSAPGDDTEQVEESPGEESEQMNGDSDSEETEADSETEE